MIVKSEGLRERCEWVFRAYAKSIMPFLNGNVGAFIVRVPIPRGSLHTMSVMPSPEHMASVA